MTLVQLMVGLAMLAIVVVLGAPNLRNFGSNTRVAAHASEVQSALAFARSEAVKRGARVTVCLSASVAAAAPACNGTVANTDGWLVFSDDGTRGSFETASDTVLRTLRLPAGVTLAVNPVGTTWLGYDSQGRLSSAAGPFNGTLRVCGAPHARTLTLNPFGSAETQAGSC